MKTLGKTDKILRRKAKSPQPSIVRRIDPTTGEVTDRVLPPTQAEPQTWTARHHMNWKRTIPWSAWFKARRRS
jgi:hypothetical protein